MTKEPHITEFTAKKGSGLHIRVTTSRNKRRIAVDGGRLYYKDYGSKNDCLRAARRIRDDILDELAFRPYNTMPTLYELYEKSYEFMPLSVSSRTYYDTLFKSIPMQDSPINTISLETIQSSVGKYALSHSHNRTKRFIELWKRIYKTAFLMQLPIIDYSAMVTVPKSRVLPKTKKTETTYNDFMKWIDKAQESNLHLAEYVIPISWIMYYTGMRLQEVLGLFESDIDLDRNLIHVQRSIGSTALKSAQIVPLKTTKSERHIPIAPALRPVLEKLVANCEGDLLFSEDGEPLSNTAVSHTATIIANRGEIRFSLYALRHLFAADLFRAGTNPKVIQSLMGHASADMSLYYAFTTEEEREKAIANRKPS